MAGAVVVSEPMHNFTYSPNGGAEEWYAWVMDVRRFIAEQYGIEGYEIRFDSNPQKARFYTNVDEQTESIVACAAEVWNRSARILAERHADDRFTYDWLASSQENLADAIDGIEPRHISIEQHHREWYDAHPGAREAEEAKSCEMRGVLF